jgi:hypothetical protein
LVPLTRKLLVVYDVPNCVVVWFGLRFIPSLTSTGQAPTVGEPIRVSVKIVPLVSYSLASEP